MWRGGRRRRHLRMVRLVYEGCLPVTTATLSDLIGIRDDSIRARPRRRLRLPRIGLARLAPVLAVLHRHILILFGCAAVVTSAAIVAPALGWLTAGASFFFLELRRRDER